MTERGELKKKIQSLYFSVNVFSTNYRKSITEIAFSRMVEVLDTFVCCNSNNDLYDTGGDLFAGIRCVFNRNNLHFFPHSGVPI